MKKANKHLQKHTLRQINNRSNVRSHAEKARRKRTLENMVRELGYDASRVHITDTEHTPSQRYTKSREAMTSAPMRATGVFTAASRGYGFVRTAEGARDIFVPADDTAGAITGDTVEVSYRRWMQDGRERTEGRITRAVERITTVIGTLIEHTAPHMRFGRYRHGFTVSPDDRRLKIHPILTSIEGARLGDKVEVLLDRSHGMPLRGRVLRSFGPAESKEANYMAILAASAIETEFSEETLREAQAMAQRPIDADARTDLRHETVFTIDGADAKDLDDALSVRRTKDGGWVLGVHIADVAFYVEEKSAPERTAMHRGCSIYFTDKVIPMLPPVLSNGVCSLNEGEDKAAISAHITLSAEGDILRTVLRPTILRSKKRGVYSEINDCLSQGKQSPFYQKYRSIERPLTVLVELYEALKSKARARGAMELESREAVIHLDADGHPTDITCRERGIAEEIIEQCMLTANEAVATLLTQQQIPCVYRIHERPPVEHAQELLQYLRTLELDTRGMRAEDIRSHDLVRVLREASEKGVSYPVSQRMLRSLAKATYESNRQPHFGLGIPCYCHFTAPIRRVSDLAVHRILRRVLLDGQPKGRYASFATRAARAATNGELRALSAERRIEQLYKALFMQDKIGQIFDATVSSVTPYGLFCMTDTTCEGFVALEDLAGMFFFDEAHQMLRSSDGCYRIGDTIRVRLCEVDLADASLRFSDASLDAYLADSANQGKERP